MRKVLVSEPLVQGEDFFRKDDHQFFSNQHGLVEYLIELVD